MSACGPSRHTAPLRDLGRSRGEAEVEGRRSIAEADAFDRRLQPLRYLHDCSGCFRLERSPGGACTHWKTPPFHGARHEQTSRPYPHRPTLSSVARCFLSRVLLGSSIASTDWM